MIHHAAREGVEGLSSIENVAGRYIEERFLDESPGLD
jgi:hypothetical protein